jgi:hypothetical protein
MWAPRSSVADMRRAEAAVETLPTHPDSLIARLQRTRQAAAAALPALLGRGSPTDSHSHHTESTTARSRAYPPARCPNHMRTAAAPPAGPR